MAKLLTLSNLGNFEKVTQKELSLVAFGTPWSSPCRIQHTILINLMRRYRGVISIARVDVEEHPGIARRCDIQTVPTLLMYRKEREIKRLVGLQSDDALSAIIEALKLSGIDSNTAGGADSEIQIRPNN